MNGHREPRRSRRLRGIPRSQRCCRPSRRDRVLPEEQSWRRFQLVFQVHDPVVLEIQLDTPLWSNASEEAVFVEA